MEGFLSDTSAALPSQWAVIALGVLTLLYVGFVRPMRKNKRKDPLERTPAQTSLAQQRAVEREMSNLLVEYEDMLRRMSAHLDTRSAKLELLMKEADEKLAAMEERLVRLEAAPGGQNSPAPASATPFEKPAGKAKTNADAPDTAPPDERHSEIYRLADRGQSARQIARKLNRPLGEVELILALRMPKPEANSAPATKSAGASKKSA